MAWHKQISEMLVAAELFADVRVIGGKVRAFLDDVRFLDVHFDSTTASYSYAVIDLTLPYPGDKRLFGWDDYPHLGIKEFRQLKSYPHHFQTRADDGSWVFEESSMSGNLAGDIEAVVRTMRAYFS